MHMGPAPEVMYVAYGATYVQEAMGCNVTDYIISAPSGWLVEDEIVYAEAGNLQLGLHITAPKSAAIDNGMALAGGYLKVLAMLEGGKQVTSKMLVTTEAFQTFSAANGTVSLIPTYGNLKHFYGIAEKDSFDPAAIEATIIAEEEADPYGYGDRTYMYAENNGWSSDGSVNVSVADLLQTAEYGKTYVLWSMPSAMINYSYVFTPGTIVSKEFTYQSIEEDEAKRTVTFNSITTEIAFNGVDSFYGGTDVYTDEIPLADDLLANINYYLSAGYADYIPSYPAPEGGVFTGNPLNLFDTVPVEPNQNYYVWFVIPEEGRTKYTAADLIMYTYSTPAPVAGGNLSVTITQSEITGNRKFNSIEASLVSEGASLIYYSWVVPEDLNRIPDKVKYLLDEGTPTQSGSVVTVSNLSPETSRVLLTLAVDAEGKYGDVVQESLSTAEYVYNAMKVSVEFVGTPSKTDGVKVKFSVSGDVAPAQYMYYIDKSDAYNYVNYLGGSAETASAYIALNSEMYWLKKATPEAAAEGIAATTSSYGDYVLVVAAKDADGVMSNAVVIPFSISFDLGNFVASKDQNGNENADWTAKKPTVNITTETVGDFTQVAWSVTNVPEGFTAQTLICHDDYLTNYATGRDIASYFLTDEYVGLEDVAASEDTHMTPYASPGYNVWVIIKDAEGNYYEPYKYECNIQGGGGFAQ